MKKILTIFSLILCFSCVVNDENENLQDYANNFANTLSIKEKQCKIFEGRFFLHPQIIECKFTKDKIVYEFTCSHYRHCYFSTIY